MRIAIACTAPALFALATHCLWADQIYKCTDAAGAIGYQATPCADGSQQKDVHIRKDTATPAPPSKYNPRDARVVHLPSNDVTDNYKKPTFAQAPPPPAQNPAPTPDSNSYECRLPNGEVFYRHDACPSYASTGTSRTTDYDRGRTIWSSNDLPVSSRQISRDEACKKMNSPGAIGREGRGRDQKVSTYDKNLGRDPCR